MNIKYYVGKIINAHCNSKDESKQIYEIYKENNWINIMKNEVKMIEGNQKKFIYRSEAEKELLDLASGKYIYKIIFTAIHTRMRIGEIAALKWRNVDFRNKKYITESVTKIKDKGIIFKEPKTKSSKRGIDISEKLNDFLKKIKGEQEENLRKTVFENYHDLVFCPVEHEILTPDFLTKRFYKLTKDTKFENITLHNLRHTNASISLKLGKSMKVTQERLGHSSSKKFGYLFTSRSNNAKSGCRKNC